MYVFLVANETALLLAVAVSFCQPLDTERNTVLWLDDPWMKSPVI
jgi:hypothetical protein